MQSRGSDSRVFRYDGDNQHRAETFPKGGLAGGEIAGVDVVEADVEALMKSLIMAIVQALVDKPAEVQIKEVIGEHAHVLEVESLVLGLVERDLTHELAEITQAQLDPLEA